MRENRLSDERKEIPESAMIIRMRQQRTISLSSGDSILFDVAAYRLDRELGVAEHNAVENNLRIIRKWPDVIFDRSAS